MINMNYDMSDCTLCPRCCHADRTKGKGMCGTGESIVIAKAYLHKWEEPPVSSKNGSGTVFFSGCSLKCCFCQNHIISHGAFGKKITTDRLGDIFLELQERGAENINLVSGSHFVPGIINALDKVKHRLHIPVVYNSGGYEKPETLWMLRGYIDIYLPDVKYYSDELAEKYSGAGDYTSCAINAVKEMHYQQPKLVYDGEKLLKGLIIRHLILPRCRHDSMRVLELIHDILPDKSYLISLMSQYTPAYKSCEHKEINRRITGFEYDSVVDKAISLGMEGFFQERSSAEKDFIPDFDLEGVDGI